MPRGCLHLTNSDDFDLTLVGGSTVSPPSSLHFGIGLSDAGSVRRLLVRLMRDDVQTSDLFESEHKVVFHCLDPDGYKVEVFWTRDSNTDDWRHERD
jgi:catechol-2,3-dioxygenase